jgi:hypothetical protein
MSEPAHEPHTKTVRCAYEGCTEVVEVSLYEDEMQYCIFHTRLLSKAWNAMWRKQRGLGGEGC